MTLTKAALETLELVASQPRETWRCTLHGWVSGRSAYCLERKGLVKFVAKTPDGWDKLVVITDAGLQLLRTLR